MTKSLSELVRADVLGTRITASTFEEALAALSRAVERGGDAVFSAATVHSVMLAHGDPAYREVVNASDYVMADGMPLVWALRSLGHEAQRVHGDDLFLAVCARKPGWRHYLLGGAVGQPERVRAALQERFPEIRIVGCRATPERPVPADVNEEILADVAERDPDVVWVGMGTPAQDRWMARHRERVARPTVGVGSAFDLLAGRTRPTPRWMKRAGLQWLHRWSQEPFRLFGRYAIHNPLFVWHFGRQWLGRRSGRAVDPT